MASFHYIGALSTGQVVSRKSNRSDFTHAAARPGQSGLPSFGTSAAGAFRNAASYMNATDAARVETVAVRIVTPAEYRAATGKGK